MLYFAPIETIEIVEKRYSFCFPLRNPLGKKFVGPSLPPRLTLTVERSRSLSIYKETSQKPYKTVRLDRLFEIVIFYPALTEIPLQDEFNSANRIRFGRKGESWTISSKPVSSASRVPRHRTSTNTLQGLNASKRHDSGSPSASILLRAPVHVTIP